MLKLVSLGRLFLDTGCYYDPALKVPKGNTAMSRIFAYCRVSAPEQHTKNQVIEIKNNGYYINNGLVGDETISGGVNQWKSQPLHSWSSTSWNWALNYST